MCRSKAPDVAARADVADGRVALLQGDPAAAVAALSAGEQRLAELDLPYPLACCRLELARAWRDRPARAVEAARSAWTAFRALGASPGVDRAAAVLRTYGVATVTGPREPGALTQRERQVREEHRPQRKHRHLAGRWTGHVTREPCRFGQSKESRPTLHR